MEKTRRARTPSGRNWTALDPTVGHEIKKTRPALVVQNDTSNQYSTITIVAPITSNVRLPLSPLHVRMPADSSTGLAVPSVAVLNQIRAVDRTRLIRRLGKVDASVLAQFGEAIKVTFALSSSDVN